MVMTSNPTATVKDGATLQLPVIRQGGMTPPLPTFRITPEAAVQEIARREAARRGLIEFSTYIAPWYRPVAHHMLVAEKLEQVKRYIETDGREGIGRLMVFEPPRHGKSEQVGRLFPAWLLGKIPDARVILTAYGADLAQSDSRAVRAYVTSPRYSNVFGERSMEEAPVELSADSRAISNWNLAAPHRGGLIAAGVGGGIAGFGADYLSIDDPFKSRDDALSELYRKRVIDWYRSVAYTRLEKSGAVVVTHTRWDQEDLAGQLLMEMASNVEADQWEVIFLPALALDEDLYPKTEEEFKENLLRGIYIPMAAKGATTLGGDLLGRKPGEALWTEKYSREKIQQIQMNIQDFEFTSLLLQMPRLVKGGFFDESDFGYVDKAPEGQLWFRYIDLALGKSEASDFNATLAVAMDGEGILYARDMLKVRNLEEFLPLCKTLMLSEGEAGTIWGVEDVSFQALVVKEFLKDPELANVTIRSVKPLGDKVTRARPWQGRAKQGKVKLVRAEWNRPFIRTATAFSGTARYDDEIDSMSGGVQMMAQQSRLRKTVRSYQG
jgi:predicted phage terminase large subunit-like protein